MKHENLDKEAIITALLAKFDEIYITPDLVPKMRSHLINKLKSNEYDACTTIADFAGRLTDDLREISNDRHIIIYKALPRDLAKEEDDPPTAEDIAREARLNFGFTELRRLNGNIGYLKLDYFADPEYAGETATAAMNFLANSDAVIIDLRENHGGSEWMVQFLLSYFFKEPIHLLTFYNSKNEPVIQSWTQVFVPGKRMVDTDLYILISSRTGSGGEAFSFDIKSYKRGTLIGETTVGAAHQVKFVNFPEFGIRANISDKRPANPESGKCWEQVGVEPDIEIPDKDALKKAHLMAFEKIMADCNDDHWRKGLEWDKTTIEAEYNPRSITLDEMEQYTGEYDDGKHKICIEANQLRWMYSPRAYDVLLPLGEDLFALEGSPDFRMQFERDSQGKVSSFYMVLKHRGKGATRKRTGPVANPKET